MQDNIWKFAVIFNEIKNRVSTELTKQASVENKLPQVLEALVVHGYIRPEQKSAAAAMLRDRETSMDFILAMTRHSPKEVATAIGVPITNGQNKSASTRPVGASPIDWNETEAGRRLYERVMSLSGRG